MAIAEHIIRLAPKGHGLSTHGCDALGDAGQFIRLWMASIDAAIFRLDVCTPKGHARNVGQAAPGGIAMPDRERADYFGPIYLSLT